MLIIMAGVKKKPSIIIIAVIWNCIEKDTRITSNCNNCYGIK
ncbi:MAG: hypothetical protein PUC12_03215 [Clostridiales bacterium]|nr:hypothetical protein [Clostridiales bacterium]